MVVTQIISLVILYSSSVMSISSNSQHRSSYGRYDLAKLLKRLHQSHKSANKYANQVGLTHAFFYHEQIQSQSNSAMQNRIKTDGINGVDNPQENDKLFPQKEFSRSLKYVMTDYDKRIRPHDDSAKNETNRKPLLIESTIAVTAFGPVSDQNGEFTISMFFREAWFDKRLTLPDEMQKLDEIHLNHHMSKYVWTPDAYKKW